MSIINNLKKIYFKALNIIKIVVCAFLIAFLAAIPFIVMFGVIINFSLGTQHISYKGTLIGFNLDVGNCSGGEILIQPSSKSGHIVRVYVNNSKITFKDKHILENHIGNQISLNFFKPVNHICPPLNMNIKTLK